MPPCFCASAALPPDNVSNKAPVLQIGEDDFPPWFPPCLRGGLLVEPDVFHSIAVVDAVDHRHEPLDIGLLAGLATRIEDDRPGLLLGQAPFDRPHQLLALC